MYIHKAARMCVYLFTCRLQFLCASSYVLQLITCIINRHSNWQDCYVVYVVLVVLVAVIGIYIIH